jgi:hypothetical protein
MPSFSDNFNRPTEGTSITNWEDVIAGMGHYSPDGGTTGILYASSGSRSVLRVTTAANTASADQRASMIVQGTPLDSFGQYAGVIVRGTPGSGGTCYYLEANNTRFRCGRIVNGAVTQETSSTAAVLVDTDEISLEITNDDLIAKIEGVTIHTWTDANIASGQYGVTATGNGTNEINSFLGEDVVASGPSSKRYESPLSSLTAGMGGLSFARNNGLWVPKKRRLFNGF